MQREDGQALILVVLAAGLAAAALASIWLTQERLVLDTRQNRAGEAAAQAAGAVVADAHLEFISFRDEAGSPRQPTTGELRAFLLDEGLAQRALAVARELSLLNGGPLPRAVVLQDGGSSIDIDVDGVVRWYRVSIEKVR